MEDAVHECRDSACRRPFGVRLRGNGWFQHSPLRHCAAPLRMTRRVWRFVRYSLFVIMLLYGTILYYPRNKHPACHSERSGTDIGNQAIKSRTAAESNPEGAPAGGISALMHGISRQQVTFPRSGTTHGSFPTKFHFGWVRLTASALCRGVIHRERHACRSARFKCNFLPFLSGSGEKRQLSKSRWTGFGSEQPEIVARNMATSASVQRKR